MSAVEGWKTFTIEQCCDILDSKRVPINAEDRDKRIGEIPYYGANGLQGYIDDYIFNEPLILIAEDGGCFDEFATRPIAYRVNGKSWVNNHAHVLRAKEGFFQDAIFYSLEHKDIQSFIVGGTRSKLNQGALRSIVIELPIVKAEQTKIAQILSTVDWAIEQTEALIAKQQRIKTGLMQDLLTRGIDEHCNLRAEETHKFKDSPLGRIPVGWEVVKLSRYITFIRSGLSRRILENDIGVPVITSTNIQQSLLDTTQLSFWYLKDPQGAKTENYYLNDGDILLNFINSIDQIGKVCMFEDIGRPAIYTTNLFRIKTSQVASQIFLFHLLDSHVVQNEIKYITKPAVNQASFTTGDFLGIPVPLIPYDEQLRIVEFLSVFNTNQKSAVLSLAKLNRIKTALMQDLLTGKKRVSHLLNSMMSKN